jgi:tRNA threonylcarbamoyladenosine biosynthesis protein TsaB
LASRESEGLKEHSGALTSYIAEVFAESAMTYSQMDAIAVSMGPGSYTGLRIGVSTAKGLCYALDKPLIAVDTLKSLTWQACRMYVDTGKTNNNSLFAPMLDARRMEVYTAIYNNKLEVIEPVHALVVTKDAFVTYSDKEIVYFGDGASKCNELFSENDNFQFLGNVSLSGLAVCMIAQDDYSKGNFADVAYCEPFYLKDFIAGKPRVKGLYQ